MNTEHTELLMRLEAWSPDLPDVALPFSRRLARDNGWNPDFTRRVIREYKRFAFLAIAAGHPVTPSDQVDQAWHLHLVYTQSYWKEFCGEVLRQPLHHGPTKGGDREGSKFNDWYGRTLASYRAFFSEEPPSDIWPPPEQRFGEDIHFTRINTARHWVVPKPAWLRRWTRRVAGTPVRFLGLRAGAIASALVLLLAGCVADSAAVFSTIWPFGLDAASFLTTYVIIGVGVFLLAWRWRERGRGALPSVAASLPELDPYETAILTAGRNRALLAGLASLLHRSGLKLDEKKHRIGPGEEIRVTHPFEQAIQEAAVQGHAGSFGDLIKSEPIQSACTRMEDRLRQTGVLVGEDSFHATRLWPTLLALTVPAIGIARALIGISHDKPVGILLILTVASFVIALAFAIRPHRSHWGDSVLARLKERHERLRTTRLPSESETSSLVVPLAVGLFGTSALINTPLADLEKKLQANDGCGAGGCGGGGCGGGCGGCGGCGG